MLRSVDVGCGAYGGGWVARWTLVDGWPRCVEAPLSIADTDPAALGGQVAVNRAITGLLEQVERYEAAQRLLESSGDQPPPAWIDSGPDGAAVPSPARAAWQAAQEVVAAADPGLLHLARTRAGTLADDEAAFVLALPLMPTIADPCEIAADFVAGAWVLRPLTAAEAHLWPLQRRPALGKLAFARLLASVVGETHATSLLSPFSGTLSLAAEIGFADIFADTPSGPGYAQQLVLSGEVTLAAVEALKQSWPLTLPRPLQNQPPSLQN
ncbi:hypothetical protein GE253_19500 [Niveispirillum sp. SYP-B3756]|uniref:hypothetical protein n=1 Tax=Niveispirillum sp. SYP-B3756 TaxID=2662178 RepID=UPI001292B382|nr:hypothetical protein [Niveispirillum sp. SYP-B3756]MQP67516.1 hypothetical protein [Niveispirillum sp. SYP-B3756]